MNMKQDEYLEALWRLHEQEKNSVEDLQTALNAPVERDVLDGLTSDRMAEYDGELRKVRLTEKGLAYALDLVRKHRLAERLLHDVLRVRGEGFESEACTFEHLVAPQVVEGICTLLGHPRECPHGLPIPEGECCRRSEQTISTSVVYLAQLEVGEVGQVAYIDCQDDAQLHRLNGLQFKPGVEVKLHQKYPAYVVECEGGIIAIDEWIAKRILLWKQRGRGVYEDGAVPHVPEKPARKRFWRRGRRYGTFTRE
ncbi:MAG TPA: metal-dependent transcriptional regulator [Candidatus Hydrogenedentes bacterium]|nr:metal-dependent transcriptional regulator [Candidatus Hydrogenedentota bacterium]